MKRKDIKQLTKILIGVGVLIGLFLVGFYFDLQIRNQEKEYRDDYIKECFDQNYPNNFDNPEEVYKGCKRLYDKESSY